MRTSTGAEVLPLVLLGICTAFREKLQASVAELVYGEPLRIPGELLTPTADPVDPVHLIIQLCQYTGLPQTSFGGMPHLFGYICTRRPRKVHTCLFLCQDTMCWALETPHSGLYWVLSWREKTLQLLKCGRPLTVSTDRVKPAYMLNETGRGTTTLKPPVDSTLAVAPPAAPPLPVA
jgi:hypothetical protein